MKDELLRKATGFPNAVKGCIKYANYKGDPPFVIYLEEYKAATKEHWVDILKNNDFKVMVYDWKYGKYFNLNEKGELEPLCEN